MSIILTFDRDQYDSFLTGHYFFNPINGNMMNMEEKVLLFDDFLEAANRAIEMSKKSLNISDLNSLQLSKTQYCLTRCCLYVLDDYDYMIDYKDESLYCVYNVLDRHVFPVFDEVFNNVCGEKDKQYFTDSTGKEKVVLYCLNEDEYDAGVLFNFYSEDF